MGMVWTQIEKQGMPRVCFGWAIGGWIGRPEFSGKWLGSVWEWCGHGMVEIRSYLRCVCVSTGRLVLGLVSRGF